VSGPGHGGMVGQAVRGTPPPCGTSRVPARSARPGSR
jgi:hypothetical protein